MSQRDENVFGFSVSVGIAEARANLGGNSARNEVLSDMTIANDFAKVLAQFLVPVDVTLISSIISDLNGTKDVSLIYNDISALRIGSQAVFNAYQPDW